MSAEKGFAQHVVDLIWARDRGRCARCARGLHPLRRGIDWAIHHRAPRGRGGAGVKAPWVNEPANGVCLCTTCHNDVESDRKVALVQGWLVSRLSIIRPSAIAIDHALHGLVYLDNDGGFTPYSSPPCQNYSRAGTRGGTR